MGNISMGTVYSRLQNKTLPPGWCFNSDSFCCSEVSLGLITFKWRTGYTDYSIEMLTDLHIPSFNPYQGYKVERTVYDEATYVTDPVTGKEIKNQKSYKVIYWAQFQYQSDGNFHVTAFRRSNDSETTTLDMLDWECYNEGIMWLNSYRTPDRNKALSYFKRGAGMGHPGCKRMVNALTADMNGSPERLGLNTVQIPMVDMDLDAGSSSSSSSSSSSYSGSNYSSSSTSSGGIGSKILGILFGIIGAVVLTNFVLILLTKLETTGMVNLLGLLGGPIAGFILGWKISGTTIGKLILIAILIGGGLFFGWSYIAPNLGKAQTAATQTQTATVNSNVNFRTESSTGDNIIRQLQQGDTVTLTGEISGGWTQVSHNGDTGWVSSEFLNKEE